MKGRQRDRLALSLPLPLAKTLPRAGACVTPQEVVESSTFLLGGHAVHDRIDQAALVPPAMTPLPLHKTLHIYTRVVVTSPVYRIHRRTPCQDFHKPFDSPAVLVVGHQTSGKSALIEALMGFQFNQVRIHTK